MKKIIFMFCTLMTVITSAHASTYAGKIASLIIRDSDGLIFIYIDGQRTGFRPECANKSYMMIKNENSATGKRQLAQLLIAQATGKLVTIIGHETCNRWIDGEDINYVEIHTNK